MSKEVKKTKGALRSYPTLEVKEDGSFHVNCTSAFQISELLGMKTHEAAFGVYKTALNALGKQAQEHCDLASAMFAELEPRNGIEAMLVSQMMATHVAMTNMMSRMTHQENYEVREAYERSVTRFSRTYINQMEALRKHRAKVQQLVRVERVNVESGAQAIVGDVTTRRRGEHEK